MKALYIFYLQVQGIHLKNLMRLVAIYKHFIDVFLVDECFKFCEASSLRRFMLLRFTTQLYGYKP
jgi:hypothetical protein